MTHELEVDLASSRRGELSPDGVFSQPEPDVENVRALYAEVSAAWRQLTDVRFKLLAFLPLVSGVGFFQLLSKDSAVSSAPRWARALGAAFGFTITAALFIYERRNSELYDDLISRGKHLERELGASSGVFLGRLSGRWPVRHDVALFIVYWATLLGWLIIFFAVVTGELGSP